MNPVLNKKKKTTKLFFTIEIPAKDFENAVQKAYLKKIEIILLFQDFVKVKYLEKLLK